MWKSIVVCQATDENYGDSTLHAGYLSLQIHTGCVILIVSALQQWLHKRPNSLPVLFRLTAGNTFRTAFYICF